MKCEDKNFSLELNLRWLETLIYIKSYFLRCITYAAKSLNSFLVSSYNEEDMKNLRTHVIDYFLSKQDHYDLFIPYEQGEAHSKIRGNANIIKNISHEQGIFYRIRIPDFIFQQLGLNNYILAPLEAKQWEQNQPLD